MHKEVKEIINCIDNANEEGSLDFKMAKYLSIEKAKAIIYHAEFLKDIKNYPTASCALCWLYSNDDNCGDCPLKEKGHACCSEYNDSVDILSSITIEKFIGAAQKVLEKIENCQEPKKKNIKRAIDVPKGKRVKMLEGEHSGLILTRCYTGGECSVHRDKSYFCDDDHVVCLVGDNCHVEILEGEGEGKK